MILILSVGLYPPFYGAEVWHLGKKHMILHGISNSPMLFNIYLSPQGKPSRVASNCKKGGI